MMKKWMKNVVAGAVCLAMLGTTFGMDYLLVKADTTENNTSNVKEIETEFEVTEENSGYPIKEETVFITTDASGKTTNIEVSDWLKNPEGYEVLKDATNLVEIENVNGEELFMRSDEELSIQANAADIYYRGEADATTKTPITLTVSYELDGVAIEAAELEEKTGHLKMTIQYINETSTTIEEDGELYNVCVPFAVTSVFMIPSEKISNISIENGKVVETGTYAMVLGFGFPGINESFGVEEGVFTDTVVLEADVEDISAQTIMTYCSNNSFRDADLEDAMNIEGVTESFEEITNTSIDGLEEINSFEELIEELDEKKEDLNRMNDGAEELKDGAKELSDGAKELKNNMILFDENMGTAYTGSTALAEGAAKATASSGDLYNGALQVSNGASTLKSGVNSMYSGIEDAISMCSLALTLSTGTTSYDSLCAGEVAGVLTTEQTAQKAAIEAGLTSILTPIGTDIAGAQAGLTATQQTVLGTQSATLTSIKDQMDAAGLISGVASLASGASQVSSGASQLNVGLSTLSSKTGELAEALGKLADASTKLEQGTKELSDGTVKLVDGTAEMKDGTQELANIFEGDASMFVNTGKALQKAAENYTTFTTLLDGEEGSVSFVIKTE